MLIAELTKAFRSVLVLLILSGKPTGYVGGPVKSTLVGKSGRAVMKKSDVCGSYPRNGIACSSREALRWSKLKLLLRATVPLVSVVALPASAQEIDTERTSPVRSSTVDGGAPGDVVITEAGSISITDVDGVSAVTIDSDNSLLSAGTISLTDSDGAAAVRLDPGRMGDVSVSGALSIVESYERVDEDQDGDLDGVFAIGVDRFGILLGEGDPFTGDIVTITGSTIAVEGNQSAGIRLGSQLDGDLTLDGSITVLGDDAKGLEINRRLTGNALLSGGIAVTGQNAVAVNVDADVDGALTIESSLVSTGFSSTSLSNYVSPAFTTDDTPALEDRLDAEALLDNRAGVMIGASLDGGLLINGPTGDFIAQDDLEDESKDTVEDFDENRGSGSIVSIGSGTALLISPGSTMDDLTIGEVKESIRDTLDDDQDGDVSEILSTFDYDFGLINRGAVIANGQNVGFSAQSIRIEGDTENDREVVVTGGIHNTGDITATAFEADAAAITLGPGAVVSRIRNDGTISATTSTRSGDIALAVVIEEGAQISEITNSGDIIAIGVGTSADVTALLDESGQLRNITNVGGIQALTTSDGQTYVSNPDPVAIDVSAFGEGDGVDIVQRRATPTDDTNLDGNIDADDVRAPFIVGDIRFGAGDDSLIVGAGSISGNISFNEGDAVFELSDASVEGDVTFKAGTHNLRLSNATIDGGFRFTDATAELTLTSGTQFSGMIETVNSLLDVEVESAALELSAGNRTELNSLRISGDSNLILNIDPRAASGAILAASGAVNISGEAVITPVLSSINETNFTQTLISGSSIVFDGELSEVGFENLPYIYIATLELDNGVDAKLNLKFNLKSAEDLGLDENQSAAFRPLLGVFQSDDELGAALATVSTKQEFDQLYDLLLPQRTNASTRYLVSQSNASFGALQDRLDALAYTNAGLSGVWIQEHITILDQSSPSAEPGFNGSGIGFSMGADRELFGFDNVGIMLSYSSGRFEETTGGNNPVNTSLLGVGTYVQERVGPIDVRLAGQIADVDFASRRELSIDDLFFDIAGQWSGISQSASLSLSTELKAGSFYARPAFAYDWFSLSQDGYTEKGGDELLAAEIGKADTDESSVVAVLALGREFQLEGGSLRAEVSGGYKSVVSSTPFVSSVSYLGSEESFTLSSPDDADEAALFGLSLVADGQLLTARFGYDVELSEFGEAHNIGATLRLKF